MPSVSVVGIVTKTKKREIVVLLTPRKEEPFKGQWSLPVFQLDAYEPVRDAVEREVKEITGLVYTIRFFEYFDEIIPSEDIHEVVLTFECLPTGKLLGQDDDEVRGLDWFPLDEAKSTPLAFEHNKILDAYTSDKKGGALRYLGKRLARYTTRWIGLKLPVPRR